MIWKLTFRPSENNKNHPQLIILPINQQQAPKKWWHVGLLDLQPFQLVGDHFGPTKSTKDLLHL